MKPLAFFSIIALAVLLGVSAPVQAQQEETRPQEERRAEPDGKAAHEQEKQGDRNLDQPRENRQGDKEANHDRQQVNQDRQQDRDQDKNNRRGSQEEPSARQGDRHEQQAEGREGRQGKQGGRIPDDRFRANFGREHRFVIGRPVIVEGAPRFQYGGYWFVIVQPWPAGWGYEDEVYVDYFDGEYFLLSPVHPGVQIAINVIF